MQRLPKRTLWTVAGVTALAIALALPAVRLPLLRGLGAALVREDAVEPADVIVVATGADGAGVLEAADLVHRGVSSRVAVFADPPDAVDEEFIRRGLQYFNEAEVSVQQLRSLGVSSIVVIPRAVEGTEDEGRVLPGWCDQLGLRTILVVNTPDHTRRMRRVLERSMAGHSTRVMIRGSRYAPFDAARWWLSRDGTRIEIIEMQKLIFDWVRHPFS